MNARCTAQAKGTGDRCKLPPIRGARVCRKHGGSAGQVKAKAGQRAAERRLQQELHRIAEQLGPIEPVANPLAELSLLAGEALRWKEVIARQVEQLDEFRYQDFRGGEQVRGEVLLFERALDRCASILVSIVRLNIDERLAVIDERQAQLLAGVFSVVLERAGLDEKSELVRSLLIEELRALDERMSDRR
jgi:hypothetical protein